jgi:acetoin utilization deacetylase AcuC-like enzyme
VNIFFDQAFTLLSHSFETTRKAAWIAESMRENPIPGVDIQQPKALEKSDLMEVHSVEYVEALESGDPRQLAESHGFPWEPNLFPMVLSTSGGVVAAVEAARRCGISGSLSTGLHHARRAMGKGFCAVNGLAIAAKKALRAGCQRVLILDMDAHCGGGTQDCISNESKVFQVDLSVHPFDRYQPAHNSHLVMVDHGADYLTCIEHELETLASRDMGFDLCLYNAGMDPFEFCPHGGLEGVSKRVLLERERMVFRWCLRQRIPVAFVIAGGYLGGRLERQDLVGLHRMTIEAAAEELQESKPSATA